MDSFEPSAFGPLGRLLMLAVQFVWRELPSDVWKEAGKALWGWTGHVHAPDRKSARSGGVTGRARRGVARGGAVDPRRARSTRGRLAACRPIRERTASQVPGVGRRVRSRHAARARRDGTRCPFRAWRASSTRCGGAAPRGD